MANSTGSDWTYAAAIGGITSSTAAVSIKPATTGQRTWVSSCQIMADTGGVATELVIRDITTTTVLFRTKIPTTGITFGNSFSFDPPLQTGVGNGVEIVALTATTNSIYLNAQGFTAP